MIEHKKQTFVNTLRSGYKKEDYVRFLREMLNNVEIKAPDKACIWNWRFLPIARPR